MPKTTIKKRIMRLLGSAICIYLLLLISMTFFQRALLYHPVQSDITPQVAGLAQAQPLSFLSNDGQRIHYWAADVHQDAPWLLFFHGNAGHLGNRATKLKAFLAQGFNVAILSYRGFGASEGTPSEAGIYDDAEQWLHLIKQRYAVAEKQLILYGESLGTGVAAEMATRFDAGMLVLEAPYTSVTDRAGELYPWLPVRLLLVDRYETFTKLERIDEPLLLFHGEKDSIIPSAHGRRLHAQAHEPKRGVFVSEAGHNNLSSEMLAIEVKTFAAKHLPQGSNKPFTGAPL